MMSLIGFHYLKAPATMYVVQYRGGKMRRKGTGLAFYYFAPWSVIAQVPTSTLDVPFAFTEVSSDFQDVIAQGTVTYRVANPEQLLTMLDYSVDRVGRYTSDDPSKLKERIVQSAQSGARSFIQSNALRDMLTSSQELVTVVRSSLQTSETLAELGVEVMDVTISSLKADPEIAKALQAESREQLLQEADEAVGARRNAAVEMERTIRENELLTERLVAEKEQEVREAEMKADISVEEQRSSLVDIQVDNRRKEAEAEAAALEALLSPVQNMDWRVLLALGGGDASAMISGAFEQLANNADKIGELNISSELLQSLLQKKSPSKTREVDG